MKKSSSKGEIVVLSAPSGGGKTTISNEMKKQRPDIFFSISATTRKPRSNEINGKDYYFFSKKTDFEKKIKENYFVEWAIVHNHYYGTPRKNLDEHINKGKICILDIDVQGALNIKREYPEAVLIFIIPPSLAVLEKRLKERKTDSEVEIKIRLNNAKKELTFKKYYDHVVVNDTVANAVKKILEIIN